DIIRERQMGVMEGSSFGLRALLRSRLTALAAIACLAAGCAANSSSPGSLGGQAPPIPASRAAASPGPATAASSLPLQIVPWLDRPAPAYVEPTPRPYPTDARPCRPADLAVRVGEPGVGMGNTNLPVEFVNTSGSTCLLDGYPTISGLRSGGRLLRLPV